MTVTSASGVYSAGDVNLAAGKQYKINGSQIGSSNLSDSTNIDLLNGNQAVTGIKTFTSSVTIASDGFSVGGSTLVVKNGNVGIGLTDPDTALTIKSGLSQSASGENALKLDMNVGAWTVGSGARVNFTNLQTTKMAAIRGYIFGTADTGLAFETGWDTNSDVRMVIKGNGNVGIGTLSPSTKLEVVGSYIKVSDNGGANTNYAYIQGSNDVAYMGALGTQRVALGNGDNWETLTIDNGNVGIGTTIPDYTLKVYGNTWCSSGNWSGSDKRFKINVESLPSGVMDKVMRLKPITYNLNKEEIDKTRGFDTSTSSGAYSLQDNQNENDMYAKKLIGIIAQDIELEFPELVTTDASGYKAVAYDRLAVVLVEALKEQQKKIGDLELRLKMLETK
jgi:hypothetical protein